MAHRCPYPGEEPNATYAFTNDSWLGSASSLFPKEEKSCMRISGINFSDPLPSEGTPLHKETCEGHYIWDYSLMDLSAVKYWELNCDHAWIRSFVQAMYYVGQFFGSLILGPLSDKIGRKTVFFLAILIQVTCGAIMAYIPWWPLFALFRIGVGFAHPGIFLVAVVIGMELVGPSRRMLGGIASGLFFAAGQIVLGLLAYVVRDYRNFQLVISLPALVFVSYWWLVPESARWLLSQRRFLDADRILQRAAKINKRTLPPDWYEQIDAESKPAPDAKETRKGCLGVLDAYASLFRTPSIRRRTLLASCICWPAVSMVYYGLAMNPGFMGGDNRLGFIVGGILEFPSLILVLVTINILGRKFICMIGFLLAGLCLFLTMVLLWADPTAEIALLVLVVIGKSSLTGVYATLYIFTPELFPTTVRSTAMGLCSMIARVGAVSASFIAMYLADVSKMATCLIFAVLATAAGFACIGLPETAGQPFLETIEEAEHFGKHLPMFKFMEKKKPKGGAGADEPAQEMLMRTTTETDGSKVKVPADAELEDKGAKKA